jgi:hypothetical protein
VYTGFVKKIFAIFVALVLTLQSFWAVAESICVHTSALADQSGAHHMHGQSSCHPSQNNEQQQISEAADVAKTAALATVTGHADCGGCHLIHVFDIPAERTSVNAFVLPQSAPVVSLSAHASWVQPAPDRPNWLF